jgi:hypothetical protein
MAQDSRLLVFSIQLPPPGLVSDVEQDLKDRKGEDKIKQWGSVHPEKFAKKMIKSLVPSDVFPVSSSGVMAIYGGYVAYSDKTGMITFPLRHDGLTVNVIFTPNIDIERLYKETYSGIFINQKAMVEQGIIDTMLPQQFSFVQQPIDVKKTDSSGGDKKNDVGGIVSGTWQVNKSSVGMDVRLPADALIILINPKNIFVPLGNFSGMFKPHIVLPDTYLVGKKFNDTVLINNQKYMRFFEEIVVKNGTVVNKNVEVQQSAVVND